MSLRPGCQEMDGVQPDVICFGTWFQRSDCPNSSIHLWYVTTVSKSRPSQGLSTDVLHSWWKEIKLYFGWFCVSFRNTSVRSGLVCGSLSEIDSVLFPAHQKIGLTETFWFFWKHSRQRDFTNNWFSDRNSCVVSSLSLLLAAGGFPQTPIGLGNLSLLIRQLLTYLPFSL